ncbi:MAG TPA: PLD nuclease N-terminal domain-containing protein [Microbacterium sp.]|uniref:PLD nuclease N-terminal domain-containing protein n=1 Tax=Microbacterium sp. TaxID=51671 RepID=UPI002B472928|nr:PLD nuclease N-terminal domain-containing protein [Microbacterium sp.]HKT56787.1 PLD nuclease N-terminal domain-containing protein [Microbacterium sp.]
MWFLSLLLLAAMVFAIVDIVLRDNAEIKHLPKVAWLFLVILVPLLGTVLWFTLGRDVPQRLSRPRPTLVSRPAGVSRPAAPPAPSQGRDVRTTEQQLADLEREIEEDRLRAEIARKRAERDRGSED